MTLDLPLFCILSYGHIAIGGFLTSTTICSHLLFSSLHEIVKPQSSRIYRFEFSLCWRHIGVSLTQLNWKPVKVIHGCEAAAQHKPGAEAWNTNDPVATTCILYWSIKLYIDKLMWPQPAPQPFILKQLSFHCKKKLKSLADSLVNWPERL